MFSLCVTLGAFALILVLARFKVPLAAAIAVGAIGLGLAFSTPPVQVGVTMLKGSVQQRTIGLLVITFLQLLLSGALDRAGELQRIVGLARAVLRRPAVTMAALPALIGLMPMPGGALFSAPMVEAAAGEGQVTRAKLSAINYWYRHIWEFWWPLYPGVILAMTLTGLSFGVFAAVQLPLGLFMATAGILIFRHMHPSFHSAQPPAAPGTKRALASATMPIWIIVLIALPLTFAVPLLPATALPTWLNELVPKYGPIFAGLLVAFLLVAWRAQFSRADLRDLFTARKPYTMAILVVSVMVFQYVLGAVGAPQRIAEELQALHVPLLAVVMILPAIAGAVTGLAVGFVGTSFPIVLPLVQIMTGDGFVGPYMALAYAFGHLGMMMSPMHLCHIVSNQYFETPFGPVYKEIVPSAVTTGLLAFIYVMLLNAIL